MSEATRPVDWRAWVLVAIVALLPFGAAAEVPLLVASLAAIATLHRTDWQAPRTRLALLVFAAYWLPEVASALDSWDARKSWLEVAVDLRFGLLLLFALRVVDLRVVLGGIAGVLAFWLLDALSQAATGWSLGGPATADRLSGIFGDGNLKLGGVVAVLSPFLMLALRRARALTALALLALLVVILLAGARAAWVTLAVALAAVAWSRLGGRRGSLALAGLALAAVVAALVSHAASPRFAERVDRTAAVLRGDRAALDHALSHRLPIWDTALAMTRAHPVNGVGVRAFNEAYAAHAAPGDRWLDPAHGSGALHAHQWVLEVLSETGTFGLACWIAGIVLGWRVWSRFPAGVRGRAAAPGIALLAMLFPFNTHYAMYSTFWGTLLFAMLAAWIAALRPEAA